MIIEQIYRLKIKVQAASNSTTGPVVINMTFFAVLNIDNEYTSVRSLVAR